VRRYQKREKVAAVIAAEMSSLTAASEQMGIPMRTLSHWRQNPELAELAKKTREEMADDMKVLAHLAAARLTQLVPTMEPRDLTVLLGVATDKGLLLSGEATARTETRSLTEGWNDHERKALREAVRGAIDQRDEVPA
jgi:hypothetical protein